MKAGILLTILILGAGHLNAQSSGQIQTIRDHFNYVSENLSSFRLEKSQTFEESADGADISKYYDGEDCIKIRIEYYGETGKLFREYYVKNKELLFTFDQEYDYNMPYYMDSARATQSGFDEWFDPQKTKIRENRFYFMDGKMVRWIDENGKYISDDADEWNEKEKFYLDDLESRLGK